MTSFPPGILDALPHRPPFRFISEVYRLAPRTSAEAVWRITGDEAFFAGHFPGEPVVPGILLTEALAQLSGLVGFYRDGQEAERAGAAVRPTPGKLAHVDIRFKGAVVPPAEVVLRSRLDRVVAALLQFEVAAVWQGKPVALGRLTLAAAGDRPETAP